MQPSRRSFLGMVFAAPAIIRIPGLLMPIRTEAIMAYRLLINPTGYAGRYASELGPLATSVEKILRRGSIILRREIVPYEEYATNAMRRPL